jgi:anti-sigma-K factor RskA
VDCKTAEELAPGYSLSILSTAERRGFEKHLASCDNCSRLVREHRAIVDLMPLATEEAAPSPGVKAALLERVRTVGAAAPQPRTPPRAPSRWRGLFGRPAPYALAAGLAVAAVAGLAIWNVDLQNAAHDRGEELARLRDSVRVVKAAGTEAAPGATGELIVVATQGITTFRATGLPPLTADRTYQMWLFRGGTPISAGLVQTDASRQGVAVVQGELSGAEAFAVTIEPAGGLPQPSGQVVLRASL